MKRFTSLLLTLAALALSAQLPLSAAPLPEEGKVGGFLIGCQAYTFRLFTLFEAIEKTAQAGGTVIELSGKQKLSKEQPDVIFNHDASEDAIAKVKAQLAQHRIRAVNYGVVNAKDEAEWRRVFEFAKKMGLYAITTEDVEHIDIIEKLVKEFDIKAGYHEHAKRMKKGPDGKQVPDESYKVWDPAFVRDLMKGRDPRMGACADTGHWQTSGIKPVDGLRTLEGRIISVHLKERAVLGEHGPDIIYGTGVSDTAGVLDELKRQKFSGHISIEYENHWEDNVPDVKQCIDFVRKHGAAK